MLYKTTIPAILLIGWVATASAASDPLPSWQDGPAKESITAFVADVTSADGPNFVPPAQRIAVFDNDGTLWVEQPVYTQLAFVLDRVGALAPEQVIGSQIALRFELQDGKPVIVRESEIAFIDDKAGKPVGIHRHIGRRPILAFGNSDGDLQMLQWTTAGPGPRLGLILHHDDAEREYAYDRESHIGRLDQALDLAPGNNWVVVSMKDDWSRVFSWAP